MDHGISLLLTVLDVSELTIRKVAVKVDNPSYFFSTEFQFWAEQDVSKYYAELFPELKLGYGFTIVGVEEINSIFTTKDKYASSKS
jgi:hypothetical protein